MPSRAVEPAPGTEERPEGAPIPPAQPESPTDGLQPLPRRRLLEGLGVIVLVQALQFAFLPALRTAGQTFYEEPLVNALGPEKHGLSQWLHDGFFPFWARSQLAGEPYIAPTSPTARCTRATSPITCCRPRRDSRW